MNFKNLPKEVQARLKAANHPAARAEKTSKYGAVRARIDDISFDSKAEAARYTLNKLRIAGGELAYQLLQVPFRLPGGVKYIVDFVEFGVDGSVSYVDVKGQITSEFKLKKKQVEALYPVKILCLKCKNRQRLVFEEVEV